MKLAAQIIDQEGDYILALKGNQGMLSKEVEETFVLAQADHFAQIQHAFAETREKGHGRLEIRRHWIIDDPEHIAYLNKKGVWKGLKGIGMVQSERHIGRTVTKETRYSLLSFEKKFSSLRRRYAVIGASKIVCIGCSMWPFEKMILGFVSDMRITM